MGIVTALSTALHTREDGLRLFLTILAGYPLAALHRSVFFNKPASVQHIFFVAVGLILYVFNYRLAVLHSMISILIAYCIVTYLPGKNSSVVLAHVAFLGHLLLGYHYAETDHYDITWTTPFCVMTLRFTGLVMDVYDGQKPKDKLKPYQLKTAIKNPPGLLELAAFGYFFCGTFVGPLFSLARFRAFVAGEFLDEKKEVRSSGLMASLGRFIAACFFAVIFQWGTLWIPNKYLNSPEFFALPFRWKVLWITLWFRFVMSRYIAAWLFTEGAAILSGIAYNGKDANNEDRWNGVRDVNVLKWEFGLGFQSVIDSFNVGTNTFAKNHVYRRLRWLGNQLYSHLITLIYLAIWHGYHLGYFVLFIFEFFCVSAEKQFYSLLKQSPQLTKLLAYPYMYPIKLIVGRIVINVSMAVAFLSFGLINTRDWIKPMLSVYCFPHVFFMIIWPLFSYNFLNQKMALGSSESQTSIKSSRKLR